MNFEHRVIDDADATRLRDWLVAGERVVFFDPSPDQLEVAHMGPLVRHLRDGRIEHVVRWAMREVTVGAGTVRFRLSRSTQDVDRALFGATPDRIVGAQTAPKGEKVARAAMFRSLA